MYSTAYIFQLTTSQGGRPISMRCNIWSIYFNSRPRKEVDWYWESQKFAYKLFQLTTSQGGRPTSSEIASLEIVFQLTTSQGGRLKWSQALFRSAHFNSRPRKEVDGDLVIGENCEIIFQLTTSQGGRRFYMRTTCHFLCISTHDLARRSTMMSGISM